MRFIPSFSVRRLAALVMLAGSISLTTANSFAAEAVAAGDADPKAGITAASYDDIKSKIATAGFTFTQSKDTLDILVDQSTLLSAIPELSREDAIIKVDPQDLKNSPMSVAVYAVDVSFTVTILAAVYAKDTGLDKLRVNFSVKPAAGKEKQTCFTFDYTRKMYDNLNMNTTSTNDFITKTPGFAFSSWCQSILDKEDKAATAAANNKTTQAKK